MPPPPPTAEASRAVVPRASRELADEHGLGELSMGTTQDYRVAAEEGATYVRVGSVLFGDARLAGARPACRSGRYDPVT